MRQSNYRRATRCLIALVCLTYAVLAMAQSTGGRIQGRVSDQTGAVLANVKVTLVNDATSVSRDTKTDAEGVATLEALAPSARYTVKAQLSGFRDLERTDILVRTGQVTTLRAELALSTVTENVTVQGQTGSDGSVSATSITKAK